MFKGRIFAGPAGKIPEVGTGTIGTGTFKAGSVLAVANDVLNAGVATNFGARPVVIKDKAYTEGGQLSDTFTAGDSVDFYNLESGHYYNVLVGSGTTVTKDEAYTFSATGVVVGAAGDGTQNIVLFAEENSAAGAERLVRMRRA